MKRKLFISICIVSLSVLVCASVLLLGFGYRFFSTEYRQELLSEAKVIAQAADMMGEAYITALETPHRLTWIAADGTVLFDDTQDESTLDNHLQREEVRSALETGTGISERYSHTLSRRTVNAAVRLEDGSVLRLSNDRYSLWSLVTAMLPVLIAVVAAAVVISMVLASHLLNDLMRPINRIDPEDPTAAEVYEELRPMTERFAAQNEQIRRQFEQLRIEHEQQDRMRREFTANVSHELKTPLTSISGYAEIMRDGLVRQEDIPRFSNTIHKEARRMITLVGDIIKLSQLDDNTIPVRLEPVDLYNTCQAVLGHLEPAARQQGVELELSGEHIPVVGADQVLDEMVYNLCDNAIKYNHRGGKVHVNVSRLGKKVALQVTDTGIGIPKSEQSLVFQRFYRVDKSHSREMGGTGLGLSIVKHGASFHNAEILMDSEEGEGTTVTILFPPTE